VPSAKRIGGASAKQIEGETMTKTKEAEPPSWLRPPIFMVGQDERGNWVAQDLKGTCGGLFVSRDAATRYIRSENGNLPQAIVLVSGILELDISRNAQPLPHRQVGFNAQPQRRTA
jgi:hypothetical protein